MAADQTQPASSISRILVPTDFSPCAAHALDYAMDLARVLSAEIHLCHCGAMPDHHVEELVSPAMRAAAHGLVEQLSRMFEASRHEMADLLERRKGQGVVLSDSYIEAYPDLGIIQRAEEWGAQLIIMGSHGRRGLSRIFLGSIAERVMRHAPCPVLVVHPPAQAPAGPSQGHG